MRVLEAVHEVARIRVDRQPGRVSGLADADVLVAGEIAFVGAGPDAFPDVTEKLAGLLDRDVVA